LIYPSGEPIAANNTLSRVGRQIAGLEEGASRRASAHKQARNGGLHWIPAHMLKGKADLADRRIRQCLPPRQPSQFAMTQSQFLQLPLPDPDIRPALEFEQARGIVDQ
jgi:hypothetical protein